MGRDADGVGLAGGKRQGLRAGLDVETDGGEREPALAGGVEEKVRGRVSQVAVTGPVGREKRMGEPGKGAAGSTRRGLV